MINIKEEIKKAKKAIANIEKRIDMSTKDIETIEEFEAILKKINCSPSKKSFWRTGTRKPDWKSLKILHENGIPLESWFDIESYLKKLRTESVKRKIENE